MHPERMMGLYVLVIMHFGFVLLPLTVFGEVITVLGDIMILQIIILLETLTIILFTLGMMKVSRHELSAAECWGYLLTGD